MTRHNLFSFATSELSQDAFLCWLAALADHDDPELQQLGKAFIAWLWERARGSKVEAEQVRLRERPKPQWKKIDITLEAAIGERECRFIIEDKTDTTQHGDQLKRYLEVARADGSDVVPIYFKTGYYFGSDRAATVAQYTVVELRPWVEFLRAQTAQSDILDDYRAYVANILEKREQALARLSEASGFEAFKHDFVQYEFLEKLANRCPEAVGGSAIHRGTNLGGSPWTHYRFVFFTGLPAGVDEVLFHRIDKRQNDSGQTGYYLSTRQYASVKEKPDAAAAKLARLTEYRRAFSAAIEQAGTGLRFSKPAADFRGANESEVGILFFDARTNSTTNVLEQFPAVHRAFVAGLAGRTRP
ncbi:MAG TPA: hypothetical protein VHB79_37425 [Polyangiaceae bacterium]|nr:hypothetical protein [Polyangiaceae bacterium]